MSAPTQLSACLSLSLTPAPWLLPLPGANGTVETPLPVGAPSPSQPAPAYASPGSVPAYPASYPPPPASYPPPPSPPAPPTPSPPAPSPPPPSPLPPSESPGQLRRRGKVLTGRLRKTEGTPMSLRDLPFLREPSFCLPFLSFSSLFPPSPPSPPPFPLFPLSFPFFFPCPLPYLISRLRDSASLGLSPSWLG